MISFVLACSILLNVSVTLENEFGMTENIVPVVIVYEDIKKVVLVENATVTYYCDGEITASGKKVSRGMIAAPRSVPFGTKVEIDGVTYTVEDRTHKRYNGRWDIYLPDRNQCLENGKQIHDVMGVEE